MNTRSQQLINLNQLNPGSSIFKDENQKLFMLFTTVCKIVTDSIKNRKILGTEDSVQKILFDIAHNFYVHIQNLNWYTSFESKLYSDEYYNNFYRDQILKETTKVKKIFYR